MTETNAETQTQLRKSCGRAGGRTEEPRRERDPQGTLGGSQELNYQTESIQGLDLAATNPASCRCTHLGPPTTGAGAYSDSVACLQTVLS